MNASTTATKPAAGVPTLLTKADPASVAFVVTGRDSIAVKAGTTIDGDTFVEETPIAIDPPELVAGTDYQILVTVESKVIAVQHGQSVERALLFGGFHYAPGGNAAARAGGDDVPAINPLSLWDLSFRPACPDPRGMAYVAGSRGGADVAPFWVDIYLTAQDHLAGTSRFGAVIADGRRTCPQKLDGKGHFDDLNFHTAKAVLAHHGKSLPSLAEFFAAAYGVTEKTAAGSRVETAGLDAPRTSSVGMMQATGQRYVWGHDGDPDEPRASIFGGGWGIGGFAGSRYAYVEDWPGNSYGWVGARGRSDHFVIQ